MQLVRGLFVALCLLVAAASVPASGQILDELVPKLSPVDSAKKLFQQGNTQFRAKKYTDAVQSWRKALRIFEKNGVRDYQISSYTNLGIAYETQKLYNLSLKYYLRALDTARVYGDKDDRKSAYTNVGDGYKNLDEPQSARDAYKEALALAVELKSDDAEKLEKRITALDEIISSGKETLARYKSVVDGARTGHPDSIGTTLVKIGKAYAGIGDFGRALRYYREAIEYFQKSGNRNASSGLMVSLAKTYRSLKDLNRPASFASAAETVSVHVRFRISELVEQYGDSAIVQIDAGTGDGIFIGAKGEVTGVYSKDYPKRGSHVIGRAEVISAGENSALVRVVISDIITDEGQVMEGDMAMLPAHLPKLPWHSIFYDMALLNIEFMNNEKEPLFHFRQIIGYDSPEFEADVLQAMVNDVHGTYENFKDQAKDQPILLQKLSRGKFRDVSVIDAMGGTDAKDIRSFLRFVKNLPGKYFGHTWRIDETFATWLLNNAPLGQDELLEDLFAAKTDVELRRVVLDYAKEIEDYNFVDDWHESANTAAQKGDFARAYRLNDLSTNVGNILQKKEYQAAAVYNRAEILEEEHKYDDAITYYSRAREMFKDLGDLRQISNCLSSIANIYSLQDKYQESFDMYQEVYKVKLARYEKDSSMTLKESIANTLWRIGLTLYNMSKYQEALDYYKRSLAIYDQSTSLTALKNKAYVNKKTSDVYDKLSDYKMAVAYAQTSLAQYREIGDRSGEAGALVSWASALFSLDNYEQSIQKYNEAYAIYLDLENKKSAGFCKSNVGQAYWNLGDYQNAIKAHKEAIALREAANDPSGQAYSWNKLAKLYYNTGDPARADSAYMHALHLYEQLDEKSGIATTYNNLGELYQQVKDYPKAISFFEKALAVRLDINVPYEIAETYYNIGSVYYDDKNYTKAREYVLKSLDIRKTIGDKNGQVSCYSRLGVISHYGEMNYAEAEKYYTLGLSMAREINSLEDIGYAFANLGRLYNARSNFAQAEVQFDSALVIFKKIGSRSNQAYIYSEFGSLNVTRGNFEKALDYFNKCIVLADSTKNRTILAMGYNYISDVYAIQGEFGRALEYAEKGLKINADVQNPWGIGDSYITLGNIRNRMGDYNVAIGWYLQADSVYASLRNELARATPMNNIGTIYFWQANYQHALGYFTKALAILDSVHYEGDFWALVKSNIGEIHFEMKNYQLAEQTLGEALAFARRTQATRTIQNILHIYGRLYTAEKKYDDAKKYYLEAYATLKKNNERAGLAMVTGDLGKLAYLTGDTANARIYLEESIALSRSIGAPKSLWEPLFTMGLLYRDRKDLQTSLRYLKEAIDAMELLRNKVAGGDEAAKIFSSGEMQARLYETIVGVLIQLQDKEAALQYLQRSNNDALKSQYDKMDIKFKDENKNKAVTQERSLKRRVDGIDEQLAKERAKPDNQQNKEKIASLEKSKSVAESEYIKFINKTIKDQPELANYFRKNVNVLDLRRLKSEMPKDAAVIAYLTGKNQLYIFVTTTDTTRAQVVETRKDEIDGMVSRAYKFLRNQKFAGKVGDVNPATMRPVQGGREFEYRTQIAPFKEISENLYSLLISPIAAEIEGKKKLAFITNGSLCFLPFQILGRTMSDSSFRFLNEDYGIFYTTSLNTFYAQRDQRPPEMKVLAFGNPDKTLPNAEAEVNGIRSLYPSSTVFVESEATEDKAKSLSRNYSALHFATHGNLDYNDFQNTFLTLAPNAAAGEDGKLTLSEVWEMNIEQTNLVTLSACQSAVSEEMIEGWPNNPADAFLQIGVKSVIASLWQVDDVATGILMNEFYSQLKSVPKVDALRLAQQKLSHDPRFALPYYWAAFVLVGDWR